MKKLLALSSIGFAFASACSSPPSKSAETLTGDMSGATALAIVKPASGTTIMGGGGGDDDDDGEAQPFFSLVKIDADGNLDPVFNQQRNVVDVKVTPSYVVVAGNFRGVKAIGDDEDSATSVDCKLVTFPRAATGEPVKCLTETANGYFRDNDPESPGFGFDGRTGIAVRGDDVYFTSNEQENSQAVGDSQLWKWSGGAVASELLLQVDATADVLVQPWTTEDSPFLCVDAGGSPSGSIGGGAGQVYCTPATGAPAWETTGLGNFIRGSLLLGTNLVIAGATVGGAGTEVLSLYDGTDYAAGGFALSPLSSVVVGTTAYGIADTMQFGTLLRLRSDGNSDVLNNSIEWERILGGESLAYVYGEGELRELDLAAGVLGTANLVSGAGLVQVTDLSYSTPPTLRLDGTGAGGGPVIVIVNTSSGDVATTTVDIPRFQSVTSLE